MDDVFGRIRFRPLLQPPVAVFLAVKARRQESSGALRQ